CKEKEVDISMILTNGTMLNDGNLKSLIDCRPRHIGFSIDGEEEIHDEIRGIKGSYSKTISAIKFINEIKRKNVEAIKSVEAGDIMNIKNIAEQFK
ncbi:MAG: hypothetical protein GY765_39990, partial [bacterium]|nr:hypothetical protein [bacterium]